MRYSVVLAVLVASVAVCVAANQLPKMSVQDSMNLRQKLVAAARKDTLHIGAEDSRRIRHQLIATLPLEKQQAFVREKLLNNTAAMQGLFRHMRDEAEKVGDKELVGSFIFLENNYPNLGMDKCTICTKVMPHLEGWIEKKGCTFGLKAAGVAACEAIGLGPEDPMADVCAGIVIFGCKKILKAVMDHVTSPEAICSDIHMC